MRPKEFNFITIDSEKLERELKKRGMSQIKAGMGIGASKAFMGQVLKRGTIQRVYMSALEKEYNIRYEDIKPEEQEKQDAEERLPLDVPTAVFRGISRASIDEQVYRGTKKALVEMLPEIEEAIHRAMRRAQND